MNIGERKIVMIVGLVSIITPCYNGAKYLSETIDSVLAQTYQDWEMIIVDDGSKDDSAKIVQSYIQNEPRIRLIQQKNAGSAAARNNGIRQANGQYIALLDADDLWEPEFLKAQSQILWDLGFLTYPLLLISNSFRKKYSSSG